MQKIVIAKNNWGLLLSQEAIEMYLKLNNKDCFFYDLEFKEVSSTVHKTPTLTDDSFVFTEEVEDNSEFEDIYSDFIFSPYELPRDDRDLIKVIEELGDKAGYTNSEGYKNELKIVEIPDDVCWYIDECMDIDLGEFVHEHARTWD